MTKHNENQLLQKYEAAPPKIIGAYKRKGWALNTFQKVANPENETENLVKGLLQASDETYYPAFLSIEPTKNILQGVYFIAETEGSYELIPQQVAMKFLNKDESQLLPFKFWQESELK